MKMRLHAVRRLIVSVGLGCMALGLPLAGASYTRAERDSVEYGMLVAGEIDIAPDGTTRAYRLEQPERLPQEVRNLLARTVPNYRFEPLQTGPDSAFVRASMGLRMVARRVADGQVSIEVAGASFIEQGITEAESVTAVYQPAPRYPSGAVNRGITGTVYLLLRIDSSGATKDVLVEQVNLRAYSADMTVRYSQRDFAIATAAAARKWRFKVPTRGPLADQTEWIIRYACEFRFEGEGGADYGRWEAYIPGPRNRSAAFGPVKSDAPDALAAGALQPIGTGPTLLTVP